MQHVLQEVENDLHHLARKVFLHQASRAVPVEQAARMASQQSRGSSTFLWWMSLVQGATMRGRVSWHFTLRCHHRLRWMELLHPDKTYDHAELYGIGLSAYFHAELYGVGLSTYFHVELYFLATAGVTCCSISA